jgi:hypothetical protein
LFFSKKVAGDMEKLDNASKAMKKGSLAEVRAVKTVTPAGGLRKLLMVLEAALLKDDTPAAFDVLWAVEANKVVTQSCRSRRERAEHDPSPVARRGVGGVWRSVEVTSERGWGEGRVSK